MPKPFAREFYNSVRWKRCREDYKAYRNYLCERCLLEGKLTPGEIVHHKIHLTPGNIDDDSIALNFENLELLCRDHHMKEHNDEINSSRRRQVDRPYDIDADGKIIIKENFTEK